MDETVMEGPFNEYPGYNSHEASAKALFVVSAVSYRDDAILPVVAAGPPVEEDHTVWVPRTPSPQFRQQAGTRGSARQGHRFVECKRGRDW